VPGAVFVGRKTKFGFEKIESRKSKSVFRSCVKPCTLRDSGDGMTGRRRDVTQLSVRFVCPGSG
jgi:hypothetical protein